MSVQSYLDGLASDLVLKGDENTKIDKSIGALSRKVESHFGDNVIQHFKFGSSTRGTILPRKADIHSDIDYMIVFKNAASYKPQTLLNQLKRFVENAYSQSEIHQSHPTIVLELQHIKFELVPAIKDWWGTLKIPSPSNAYQDWISTDPNGFNSQLSSKNQAHGNKIKPLVRLVKYWNAQNEYIYSSYQLEHWIVGKGYWFCSNIKDYLVSTVTDLPYSWNTPQSVKDKIERAKRTIRNVVQYENAGRYREAEAEIKKLLPEFH